MLEEAKPGDNILLTSYGNGAEALLFKVTGEIEKVRDRKRLKKQLALKRELTSYEKYLAFRGLIPVEVGVYGEVAPTQLPLTWRERKTVLALYGSKCQRCGTPQYPPQRICVNPDCGAVDEMEDYCFSDKKGVVLSKAYSPSTKLNTSCKAYDVCVITAANEYQAQGYREQLKWRKDTNSLSEGTEFLVFADRAPSPAPVRFAVPR